jgi:hypothetical protein
MQEKYLKWVLIGLLGLAGLAFYLIWDDLAIGPKSVQKIKIASVESPDAVGRQTYMRLRQEINQEWVIFFGVKPEDPRHFDAAKGFIAAAQADNRAFPKVFCEKELVEPQHSLPCVELEMNSSASNTTNELVADLIAKIKTPRQQSADGAQLPPPVLVLLPNVFSTHLIVGNPLFTWEKSFKTRFMSITLSDLAISPDQMASLQPPCLGSERDREGTVDLACTVRRLSRAAQRKAWPKDQLIYQLVQQGDKDYLGLMTLPK